MSNYLICMGFDNLNGDIHYDEKLGLVNDKFRYRRYP